MPKRTTPGTDLSGITLTDSVSGEPWDLGGLAGTWVLTAIRHHL
jgi:hypothetical protein